MTEYETTNAGAQPDEGSNPRRDENTDTMRDESNDTMRDENANEMRGGDESHETTRPPTDPGEDGLTDETPMPLLEADELQTVISRWREIQAEFVDEPRRAVQDADALVSDLMDKLSRTFAGERDRLESRWSKSEDVSTEDLRRGLQRYRSFFERLLAA
jgi:hypothetical protein